MHKKLNVFLRTCTKNSLQSNRIFPKLDTVLSAVSSLIRSCNGTNNIAITIIDDCSDQYTRNFLQSLKSNHPISISYINEEDVPDDYKLSGKYRSRYSLKLLLDKIDNVPDDELIYLVEDDYLHYPDSISSMLENYKYITDNYLTNDIELGIFPQDFNQMYYDPINNPFNETYCTQPVFIIPGYDRYFRTTWFTQESFLISSNTYHKHNHHFKELLNIGMIDGYWEGCTISNVWQSSDVRMIMPMKTFAVHLGAERDISYFCNDWEPLYYENLNYAKT